MTPSGLAMATLVFGFGAWAMVTRFQIRRMLSPYSLASLTLVAIYGARPLLIIADKDYEFYGFDITDGVWAALTVGAVSLLFVSVGFVTSRRRSKTPLLPHPDLRSLRTSATGSVQRASRYSLVLLFLWMVSIVVIGGVDLLSQSFGGRSATISEAFRNVPVLVGALPAGASFLVISARIHEEVVNGRLSHHKRVVFWTILALSILPPFALGTRRFILPCLIGAAIAATWHKGAARPKPRQVILVAAVMLVLAAVPYVRSAGSRGESADLGGALRDYLVETGPWETVRRSLVSYDTEMFDYVALISTELGDNLPYGSGRGTVGDALINPLPASVSPWPLWSDRVLMHFFGTTCVTGACPVPSLPGVMYYDLGLPGVALGSLLFGMLLAKLDRSLRASSGLKLLLSLILASYIPVLVRGNAINIAYLMVNVMAVSAGCIAVDMIRQSSVRRPGRVS